MLILESHSAPQSRGYKVAPRASYHAPRHHCITQVVHSRTGSPTLLAVLFLHFAWRVGLAGAHVKLCISHVFVALAPGEGLFLDPATGALLDEDEADRVLWENVDGAYLVRGRFCLLQRCMCTAQSMCVTGAQNCRAVGRGSECVRNCVAGS